MNPGRRSRRTVTGEPVGFVLRLLVAACLFAGTAGGATAESGGCAERLPRLEAQLVETPDDLESRRATAACLIEVGNHPRALVVARGEASGDALLSLFEAKAAYHLQDFEDAREALARGRSELAERADWHLYKGMTELALGEAESASRHLDRARRLDPGQVEPVASFYAGLAWREMGDAERAEEALTRIRNDWPSSPWGERAESELAGTEPSRFRFWAEAELGLEYDSNVVLLGDQVEAPPDIERDEDGRFIWFALVGGSAELVEWLTLGIQGAYSGSQHFEVTEFDVHYPSVAVWLDQRIGQRWLIRTLYDFGYAWVDAVQGDDFLRTQDVVFSVTRDHGVTGATTVDLGWRFDDYQFDARDISDAIGTDGQLGGAPLDEEKYRNRDGDRFRVGLTHVLPLGTDGGRFSAGYHYENIRTEGQEYDRSGHDIDLALRWPLPWAVVGTLDFGWSDRPYANRSSFPSRADFAPGGTYQLAAGRSKRHDHRFDVGVGLRRPLTRRLSAITSWAYRRNRSNVEVFDSRRHLVSVILEFKLP